MRAARKKSSPSAASSCADGCALTSASPWLMARIASPRSAGWHVGHGVEDVAHELTRRISLITRKASNRSRSGQRPWSRRPSRAAARRAQSASRAWPSVPTPRAGPAISRPLAGPRRSAVPPPAVRDHRSSRSPSMRVVERDQVDRVGAVGRRDALRKILGEIAATLAGASRPGVVHQQAPHGAGGQGSRNGLDRSTACHDRT